MLYIVLGLPYLLLSSTCLLNFLRRHCTSSQNISSLYLIVFWPCLGFSIDSTKEIETMMRFCDKPQVTKCRKMNFKTGSFCLLGVDTALVHAVMIYSSVLSVLTKKKNIPLRMVGYKKWTENE